MKKPEWINGNHQRLNTGHKAFDRQVGCVGPGNVIDNVQYSSYIRPSTELKNFGNTFEPGHLQTYDLQTFRQELRMPAHVEAEVRRLTDQHGGSILYCFFSHNGGERTVHGYVLTERHEGNYHFLTAWATGPTAKSANVIEVCKEYVANVSPENRRGYFTKG